ncbi:MAG: hypothetical protein ACC682_15155 [Gemmatimonadota bacterium]
MGRVSFFVGAIFCAACGGSTTGAGAAGLCATIQGLEVCAGRTEYKPNDTLTASVRNTTAAVVFVGGCSFKVVGKTSRTAEFDETYSPTVQCGTDVDQAEILANLIEIAAGQTVEMSLKIPPFAFQGFYRVNVWILDAEGMQVSTLPAFSGTFEVFPSAGN